MKRRVIQWLGQAAISVLNRADYYVTGSFVGLDPKEVTRNPYLYYNEIRRRDPVIRSYVNRGWMVTGFEEVQSLFRDNERFSNDISKNSFAVRMLRIAADGREIPLLDDPNMLNMDQPDHTRLRKLVQPGFLLKYIQSLEPRIAAIVDECLDAHDPTDSRFDIVKSLAKPLPAIVIADMLGLPRSDLPRFQQLSDDLIGITELGNDERMEKGAIASRELTSYFNEVIEYKRANPGQDLIGRLIEAEEEGDRLTTEEMNSTCILLLVAGHETTTRLIGNGMYLLLTHREQLQLLKDNPDLATNAIEEMLRYEPPVQMMPRFVLEDTEFFGKKLKKNQLILPVIAGANRDPAANPDPDVFDITREDIRHVSFGYGIHLCLGLNLARLEGRIAINRLLARFPDMRLAEQEINWTPTALVRGMESLVIETGD